MYILFELFHSGMSDAVFGKKVAPVRQILPGEMFLWYQRKCWKKQRGPKVSRRTLGGGREKIQICQEK